MVIAAASLAIILAMFRTVEAERAERAQMARTVAVLNDIRSVGTAVLNAETGQRGYLLTLDRRYLAPFYAGRERIGPALERLRASARREAQPRHEAIVDRIDSLSRAKFEEMGHSVDLVARGEILEARAELLSDTGHDAMERLRLAIRELEQLENASLAFASAEAADTEKRVLPLLAGLLVLLFLAVAAGGRLIARSARAQAEAARAGELAEARDRADLLAKELNHRVKNLFAVILAIVQMSARNRPEARPVVEVIAQRIHALLTAHQVTQGDPTNPVADLGKLVGTALAPYLTVDHVAVVAGPEVVLPAKRATPLGLVLHELATNAVKYGAWSGAGTVRVEWTLTDGVVALRWQEEGGPAAADTASDPAAEPVSKGFGSLLMTSAARQLGGTVDRRFEPGGLTVALTFPLT